MICERLYFDKKNSHDIFLAFTDDDLGLLFPWGLWIDGHVLPADVTHLYGLVFIFPYLYLLILALALRQRMKPEESPVIHFMKNNWLFCIVIFLQLLHCIEFFLCYGALATVFGTCGLGRIIFVYYLWNSSI